MVARRARTNPGQSGIEFQAPDSLLSAAWGRTLSSCVRADEAINSPIVPSVRSHPTRFALGFGFIADRPSLPVGGGKRLYFPRGSLPTPAWGKSPPRSNAPADCPGDSETRMLPLLWRVIQKPVLPISQPPHMETSGLQNSRFCMIAEGLKTSGFLLLQTNKTSGAFCIIAFQLEI